MAIVHVCLGGGATIWGLGYVYPKHIRLAAFPVGMYNTISDLFLKSKRKTE